MANDNTTFKTIVKIIITNLSRPFRLSIQFNSSTVYIHDDDDFKRTHIAANDDDVAAIADAAAATTYVRRCGRFFF